MSFWNLNDNTDKLDTSGSFESGGADLEPIPAKTQVKAAIDEAKMDSYDGDEYISLRWTILAPEQYKNRKLFQKVRVLDGDSKKQDKAKKMLAAIAANAGGGLLKESNPCGDSALQKHLLMKPMALLLQVWKMDRDGEEKSGNWISAVSPLKKKAKKEPEPEPPVVTSDDDFDDDIGF